MHCTIDKFIVIAYCSKEDTFKLISSWIEDNIQPQLKWFKKSYEVYSNVSTELTLTGYNRTHDSAQEIKETQGRI